MQFGNDNLWRETKNILRLNNRASDWVLGISIYRSLGGKNLHLFCRMEDTPYEILVFLDDEKTVALKETKSGTLRLVDKTIIDELPKQFKYRELTKDTKLIKEQLPNGHTFLGDTSITITDRRRLK